MEHLDYYEYFGTLEKLEEFTTLTQNIIPGSLVFESPSPFWGYYNEYPSEYQPMYIYLIINRTYAVFDVTRAFYKVCDELGYQLDAAKAFVKFNDRFYNALRIRHVDDYSQLRAIQEAFARHGIAPLMINDKQSKVSVQVSLKKVFCLHPLGDGLYIDAKEKNHAYIEIPERLSFDDFANLTQKVRNNWLETRFDAALGYFMKHDRVVEIVRIYSEKIEPHVLKGIQKLYHEKLIRP
ncbi:hypothetical protein [Roseimarinus sediminis]|uniref:hypothetical protein n=1 Tax=Roseimarinus sediminis TaxID=1610899 RepID=UPI003D1F076C